MKRRRFLAVSSLAAAAPVFARSSVVAPADAGPGAASKKVQFTWDGLGLDPREYAALLSETVAGPGFQGDNYSLGGAIAALEAKFAALLGKEAALFVPTGTLANHLAIRKLAGNDRRVLVQAESHFYNDSGDCAQILSGLNLVPLGAGGSGISLDEVRQWVERSAGGRVETRVGVISIENPVRRADHAMVDFAELRRISDYARERGIRLHLDGARMFNLPLHSGRSLHAHAALFDTVYVSLWKHFNAASGAILAGDAGFIEGLFHQRRMFGGALPKAWPEAVVATRYADAYLDDYAASWQAADQLIALLVATKRFQVRKPANGTSRFFLRPVGGSPLVFADRVSAAGIAVAPPDAATGEIAMQVNPSLLRAAPAAVAAILVAALGEQA